MNAQEHDPRTVASCWIDWFEDKTSGRGYLLARFDDGGRHEVEWPGDPIHAGSNSHEIAERIADELALEVLSVDHDGDAVHATMRQR